MCNVTICVHNFGHTPAYNVLVAANFDVFQNLPDTDITGCTEIFLTGDMHIDPGQHHITAFEKFFNDSEIEAVLNERKWIVVYGYVKYTDAFDIDRETRFFHLYRGRELEKEKVRYHHIGNSAT